MKHLLAGLVCGLLLIGPARILGQEYDLLLKGGHVIDPANHIDEVRDVAIQGGKIVAVEKSLPAKRARRVVDVTDLYVTPGLIDIHYHRDTAAGLDWFHPTAARPSCRWGFPPTWRWPRA